MVPRHHMNKQKTNSAITGIEMILVISFPRNEKKNSCDSLMDDLKQSRCSLRLPQISCNMMLPLHKIISKVIHVTCHLSW